MTYKPVAFPREKYLREISNDPEAKAIYEATKLQIDIAIKLKKARLKQNMTQEEVAKIIHTKKPAISRIESTTENVKHFPSLLTLAKYAAAVGYTLNINFNPIRHKPKSKPRLPATRAK